MPRFFLADPSLISYSGHCYEYLASLAPAVRRAGYEPIYVGNRGTTDHMREQIGVVPIFTHWCDNRYGEPEHTRHVHETDIRNELRFATDYFGIVRDDVVLLNTLRHWPIRGVVDWMDALPPERRPAVAMVLHFTAYPNPEHSDGTAEFYRQAFERIAASPARDRFLVLADSDELIAEYRSIYPGLKVGLAPIPHVRAPRGERRWGDRLRIGYLGEARLGKGFDLLPRLVYRLHEAGLDRKAELHVHSFTHNPRQEFYRRALAGLDDPCVTLYPHQMDAEEYERFLQTLDMVAVPYTLADYHAQTSGVFAEAMAEGQLLVVPRGTWMARQLAAFGGGAAFNPGDAEDFAAVTLGVIRDRNRYQDGSAERAARWRAAHNPDRFLSIIWDWLGGEQRALAA